MAVPIKVHQVAHPKSKLHHLLTGAKNQQYVRDHFGALKHSCLVFEHRPVAGVFHAIPTSGSQVESFMITVSKGLHRVCMCIGILKASGLCLVSFCMCKLQGPRVARE